MLAVTFTLLFALYILGPDLASRLILGLVVARRVVPLTRGEEVSRAVVWCLVTLIPAVLLAKWWGTLGKLWDLDVAKTCFAGLYSEQFFRDHQGQWFHAVNQILWLNVSVLWRVYAVVVLLTVGLNLAIYNYGWLRKKTERFPRIRKILATFILPRVAPWHVLFSGILLPERNLQIHVDILTKSNLMYQGRFVEKQLGGDGSLVSITLAEPRRFQREQYLRFQARQEERVKPARTVRKTPVGKLPTSTSSSVKITVSSSTPHIKEKNQKTSSDFWKDIPTNLFIVVGSEISTINLRYVPSKEQILMGREMELAVKEIQKLLSAFAAEAAGRS